MKVKFSIRYLSDKDTNIYELWKSLERFSSFTRVVFTDRWTDNPIFYKFENYLHRLLVPEIYVTLNFVKIVRAVLENLYIRLY